MLNGSTYPTKEAAIAAIKADGFVMEPNSSGKGDKEIIVRDGEFPGVYNHFARPVEDPHSHIWHVLVDVNRFADLSDADFVDAVEPRAMKSARQALTEHNRTFWRATNANEWMATEAQLRAYMQRQEGRPAHFSEANDDYARIIMGITEEDQFYA